MNSWYNPRTLWTGQLPLDTAFWSYAVFGGIIINTLTSVLFLVFIVQGKLLAAVIAGYGLSIPYNTVVAVGVWRAADREREAPRKAQLYRLITLVGMAIVSLT